ncbi:polymerase [Ligilactobacillus murinus]|uniref:Polymerase n=1 Tax=Ligilactobacillus murinus TaxID=1622 RepID=A0A4Q2AYK3_9LACO|nr:polymerase [Ligilactobacillus murinus]NBH85596.1 polymerase [Lachnospiraceae bacterium]RXV74537.1 polymerase [Ligilactobacillus murinus]TGY56487.1 polymerase [Ligilactobacillus murinus]
MKKISFNKENIFCYTFFVWCLFIDLLITTNYSSRLGGKVQYIIVLGSIAILVAKELASLAELKSYSFFRVAVMVLFLLVTLKIMGNSYGLIFLSAMLFVVSARDVDFEKILKTFIVAILTLFVITIGGNKLGLVGSIFSAQNGRFRNSMGFSYVSFPSQFAFFLTAAYLVWRKKQISYIELLVLLGLDMYIYKNALTTSPFVLSLFLLGYVLVTKLINKDIVVRFSLTRVMASLTFIIAPMILWWLCFRAPLGIFMMVDKFVNNRLNLSVAGIQNFGVSLFGQKVQFITLDSVGRFAANYNYIDSSYFQNLVVNGLVFTVIILLLFTYVAYKSVYYRNDVLTVVLITLSIHAMFDPQMIILWYSPFGMLLGKYFSMDDTNFLPAKLRER